MKKKIFVLLAAVMMAAGVMAQKTWVDMGLPSGTLWASEPEDGYFTYTEAVEQFGRNLPTKWQWEELLHSCIMDITADGDFELTGKSGAKLIIRAKGWIYKNGKVANTSNGYYQTFNNFDRKYSWYTMVTFPNSYDFLQWAFKDTYHMSVLLVNK